MSCAVESEASVLPQTGRPQKVVIVGGGVAGLATAHYIRTLAQAGQRPIECTVLEEASRSGGKIRTVHEQGFFMEAGPDSFLTEKPWGIDLCRELGIGDELLPCDEDKRMFFIRHRGSFHVFPQGMRLFVPTSIKPLLTTALLSPLGKLRLGIEPFIPKRTQKGDESLAEFVTRRCGREAMERLAAPILAGIYAADPHRLSMEASFPQFIAMEQRYGSLVRGFRTVMKAHRGKGSTPVFTSLRGGMGRFAEALSASLANSVRTGVSVSDVVVRGGRFEVVTNTGPTPADCVILALPSNRAAPLVRGLSGALARSLESQPFTSSITVSLGYARATLPYGRPPRGFGFMIPSQEQQRLLGATWSSNKFPGRAPSDHFLMRLFYAGTEADTLLARDDEGILRAAREDARALTGIDAQPVVQYVARWEKGNPQYEKGHLVWLEHLDRELSKIPSLFLAGSSYTGISMSDCVKNARVLAERVIAHLA